MTRLELPDDVLWTGIPFVVRVTESGDTPLPTSVEIQPKNIEGALPFWVPVSAVDAHLGTAEMSLTLAGNYLAVASGTRTAFEIRQREDLGFGAEFGFFSVLVALSLGGVFLWHRNRRPV